MEPTNTPKDGGLSALFDFSFSQFVTLGIVKFLYILLLLLLAIGWLGMVGTGFAKGFLFGILMIFVATIIVAIEVIMVRVWLEVIVVLFRIEQNTKVLADRSGPAV